LDEGGEMMLTWILLGTTLFCAGGWFVEYLAHQRSIEQWNYAVGRMENYKYDLEANNRDNSIYKRTADEYLDRIKELEKILAENANSQTAIKFFRQILEERKVYKYESNHILADILESKDIIARNALKALGVEDA
jgi:intergrase/recombinase